MNGTLHHGIPRIPAPRHTERPGLRLQEALRLRVKDVGSANHRVVVRDANNGRYPANAGDILGYAGQHYHELGSRGVL
jgi:hypothetical protein